MCLKLLEASILLQKIGKQAFFGWGHAKNTKNKNDPCVPSGDAHSASRLVVLGAGGEQRQADAAPLLEPLAGPEALHASESRRAPWELGERDGDLAFGVWFYPLFVDFKAKPQGKPIFLGGCRPFVWRESKTLARGTHIYQAKLSPERRAARPNMTAATFTTPFGAPMLPKGQFQCPRRNQPPTNMASDTGSAEEEVHVPDILPIGARAIVSSFAFSLHEDPLKRKLAPSRLCHMTKGATCFVRS